MSSWIEDIKYRFTAEYDKLTAALRTVDKQLGETSESADKASKEINQFSVRASSASGSVSLLGRTLKAAVAIKLGDWFASAMKESISFVENLNLFRVAMGKSVDEGLKFVDRMSEIYGMDPSNLYRYTGYFYQLTDAIGMTDEASAALSLSLTKASNDIASLFNVDIETVTNNMASGLEGMSRAVRKYGMDIRSVTLQETALSYGITESVQNMSEADRMALRYLTMMSQVRNATSQLANETGRSSGVMGDFARNIETPANQLRIFKEQITQLGRAIGNFFIPVLSKILPVLNGIIMALRVILTELATFAGVELDFGGSFDGVTNDVSNSVDSVADSVSDVGDSADNTADKVKKLKRVLLSFDEINALKAPDESSSSGGGSSSSGGPSSGNYSGALNPKLLEAIQSMKLDLEDIEMKANRVRDAILGFFGGVNLEPLKESWNHLSEAGSRLAGIISGGLNWGLENVLKPLATWTIEEAGPKSVDILADSLDVLSKVLELLGPPADWVWKNFFAPLAGWTGDLVVNALNSFDRLLKEVYRELDDIQKTWENANTWGEAWKAFTDEISKAPGVISTAFEATKQFFESLAEAPATAFNNIKGVFKSVFSPESWQEALDSCAQLGTNILNAIGGPFKSIDTWIKNNILNPLGDTLKNAKTSSVDIGVKLIEDGWTTIKDWVMARVGGAVQFGVQVKNDAATWWSNVKAWWAEKVGATASFTTNVKNEAGTWWNNVSGWWKGKVGAVEKFTTGVKNEAKTWWSNVSSWWSGKVGKLSVGISITNEAEAWWKKVKSWWGEKVGTLTTKLKISVPKIVLETKTKKILGKDFTYPTGFKLKWNAKGGILNGATLFGMAGNTLLGGGEAGREAVLPLDRNTGWMDQLADRLSLRMGSSRQPITVQVVLDGKVVAENSLQQYRGMVREGKDPLAGLV